MPTLREQYDAIFDSMINGQRRQAFAQMEELRLSELPDLLDYMAGELGRPEMAIDCAKVYFLLKSR